MIAQASSQTERSPNRQYLHALLGWLHRLLAWQVDVTRETFGVLADDEYRGMYVPDAEVQILGTAPMVLSEDLIQARQELQDEREKLERYFQKRSAHGSELSLPRIGRLFGLSRMECDIILLALAPELDLRYERLFGYIQDDVTKKRPTVDLALRLLCTDPAERLATRAVFAPDAPLLYYRLINVFEEVQRQPPLLARYLKIDDRVVAEVLRETPSYTNGAALKTTTPTQTIDAIISPYVQLHAPHRPLQQLIFPAELIGQIRQTISEHPQQLVFAFQGTYGSGRQALAEGLSTERGVPLLSVALDRLRESDLMPIEAMRRVVREAMLHGATILWQAGSAMLSDGAEGPISPDTGAWRQALLAALDTFQGLSFVALDRPWEARGALRNASYLRVELPLPTYTERERLWQQRLEKEQLPESTLQALASTFRLSGGQIRDAVAMARSLAAWRGNGVPGASELYAACRAQSSGRLDALAHKISASYSWDDIVLPSDQVGQLQEICIQVRHRRTVLEGWGFDKRLAMGKGVNVLFAGPSGTGKTMAAEIIAADLGLEIYKVDLSTMVSKYIGETEKNLDKVFTAAREANAILFFDEADAIFGKRSEVKDAHDRYANIEVGYLLQKMEEYDGVVILATNLRKNLDDAFIRRLHVAIDFPFPEEPDRLRIWKKVFPPQAPLDDDVNLEFLAKQFKVAGGNIRNIALLAAYLAAEDGHVIGMNQIVRAMKREYQKLGKLITESEFGRYLSLVKG